MSKNQPVTRAEKLGIDRSKSTQEQWAQYDEGLAGKAGNGTTIESYPPGAGVGKFAETLREHGLMYAINVAILHPCRLALGVETNTNALSLWQTDDPEGWTFDALSHEEGIGRLDTATLSAVITGLRETELKLTHELEARMKGSRLAQSGKRDEVERFIVDDLSDGPQTVEMLAARQGGLTSSQVSSAIMRLGGRVRRLDSGEYELVAET